VTNVEKLQLVVQLLPANNKTSRPVLYFQLNIKSKRGNIQAPLLPYTVEFSITFSVSPRGWAELINLIKICQMLANFIVVVHLIGTEDFRTNFL